MPNLKLSTTVDCSRDDFCLALTKKLSVVPVDSTNPSLYYCTKELVKGELVHFDLYYGIYKIQWRAKIISYKPKEKLHMKMLDGDIKKWNHKVVVEKGKGKSFIFDEIDYDLGDRALETKLKGLKIDYNSFQLRKQPKTEKFKVIQKRKSA